MALCATTMGLGTGLITGLRVTHLISARRLTEDYLVRLVEGMHFSNNLMWSIQGRPCNIAVHSHWRRHLGKLRRILTMPRRERRFLEAALEGQQRAARQIAGKNKNQK